jgi:hypothetical protein
MFMSLRRRRGAGTVEDTNGHERVISPRKQEHFFKNNVEMR